MKMKIRMLAIGLALVAFVSILLLVPMRNVSAVGQIEAARTSSSCTTTGHDGTTCSVSLTWPAAFSDTNYTVVCTQENGSPFPNDLAHEIFVLPASKTRTGVKVTIENDAGAPGALLNGVGCIAVHD